jgi:hypothetical protein
MIACGSLFVKPSRGHFAIRGAEVDGFSDQDIFFHIITSHTTEKLKNEDGRLKNTKQKSCRHLSTGFLLWQREKDLNPQRLRRFARLKWCEASNPVPERRTKSKPSTAECRSVYEAWSGRAVLILRGGAAERAREDF